MSRRLLIVGASVRPRRVGPFLVEWFSQQAKSHGKFEVEVADLAEVTLTEDEPELPSSGRYTQPHTKQWAATVDNADAFVLVTPEYNHSFPGRLKLALDALYHEWCRKPVGFVSYGGQSGGLRAVEALKPVVAALGMVPTANALAVNFVDTLVLNNTFNPPPSLNEQSQHYLDNIYTLTGLLNPTSLT